MNLKPFIVEFAGPPKTGKTTIIERIKYQLPYSTSVLKEVSFDSPVPKTYILEYSEWSANELINKLIFAKEMFGRQVVLTDCGLLSQLSLLRSLKKAGRIKKKEIKYYNLIKNHLLLNLKRENFICYINMSFKKEVSRVKNYKFPRGFIINMDFLKIFNKSYREIVNELARKGYFKNIEVMKIDGALEPENNSKIVGQRIIQSYEKYSLRSKNN